MKNEDNLCEIDCFVFVICFLASVYFRLCVLFTDLIILFCRDESVFLFFSYGNCCNRIYFLCFLYYSCVL
jgi:hypothetical protein